MKRCSSHLINWTRKHVTGRVSWSSSRGGGTFHASVSVNCDQQLRETAGRRRVRVSLSVGGVLVSGTRVAEKRLELDGAQGEGAGCLSRENRAGSLT